MKKTFAVIAAVLFVLSFAASAFAIHAEIPAETQAVVAKGGTQITIGGEIRIRGWYYDNIGPYFQPFSAAGPYSNTKAIPQDSNSKANWDERVRLFVDAKVTPNVQAYIMLETTNERTGSTNNGQSDFWNWGNQNAKPAGMNIQEAWILYTGSGLFGFNSGVKAGHMPLKLAEGQFFDNTQFGDDAIVFFMDPLKELHIGLLTIKGSETGASGTNGNTTTPYATGNGKNTDDLDAYVALMTYKWDPNHLVGLNYTYINESNIFLKFQNLGLHANGKVGNFGYKAEVDFQFGSILDGHDQLDFGGWAAFLAANYKMDALNLRGSFAYGSGNSHDGDDKIKEFQTLVGTIQHSTFVYDYRMGTAAQSQILSGNSNTTGSGIANTTYYNIGLDYDWNKEISSKLDVYYLRASKAEHGYHHDNSKNIGWEIDASTKFQIAKNLTYVVNLGHLFTGNYYHDRFGVEKKGATALNNIFTLSF